MKYNDNHPKAILQEISQPLITKFIFKLYILIFISKLPESMSWHETHDACYDIWDIIYIYVNLVVANCLVPNRARASAAIMLTYAGWCQCSSSCRTTMLWSCFPHYCTFVRIPLTTFRQYFGAVVRRYFDPHDILTPGSKYRNDILTPLTIFWPPL